MTSESSPSVLLQAVLPAQEWRPMETAPKEEGRYIHVQQQATYRWQPYRQGSEQLRKGVKGRWQMFNGYGWENYHLSGSGWKDALIEGDAVIAAQAAQGKPA